jgi:hypothetical protein
MIVEFLVVRNYGIAVIFITILTIFLSESGRQLTQDTNGIFFARMIDIIIGSAIGIIEGWILFHEKVHFYTTLQLRKSKVLIRKVRSPKNDINLYIRKCIRKAAPVAEDLRCRQVWNYFRAVV